MENASKALNMAASVIIGVLLLALLVFAYNRFIALPQQQERNTKIEQTAEFNQKYEAYNKQNLKGIKLISLLNMARDNNITYRNTQEYQINIEVNGIVNYQDSYTVDNVKPNQYNCSGVEHNRT